MILNCEDMCEGWKRWFPRGTESLSIATRDIKFCRYCGSELVDKGTQFREEFWQDVFEASKKNDDDILFDKYEIKKK